MSTINGYSITLVFQQDHTCHISTIKHRKTFMTSHELLKHNGVHDTEYIYIVVSGLLKVQDSKETGPFFRLTQ